MLNALIGFSLKNRFAVMLLAALLVYVGIESALHLPLDAFPDTTPNQVQINSVAPALAPEEIERQVTLPVELSLGGMKGLQEV
ncbi:MAG TPA: efflux RND transporter permease subunit, partial [Isosphaeraceae bacterium]|nr:efflux RND transporter permease subunit [Isosphaeraceae bacterium]